MELFTHGSFTKPPIIGIFYAPNELEKSVRDNEDIFDLYQTSKVKPEVAIRLELFSDFCHLKLEMTTADKYRVRFYNNLNYNWWGLEKWITNYKDKNVFTFCHVKRVDEKYKVVKTRGEYSTLVNVQSFGIIERLLVPNKKPG